MWGWRRRYDGWHWPWPGNPASIWLMLLGIVLVSLIIEGVRWLTAAR
ncbi:hypothetical protein [Symbiobacterium terraclitae]